MQAIQVVTLQCPHCWESIECLVDCSVGDQEYVEDCSVCCRPMLLTIAISDGGHVAVNALQENA